MMNPDEFDLGFFTDNDFTRRQCRKCGRYFWSLRDWETCGEPPCEEYTFIDNSPMNQSLDLHDMRETYLSFFEEQGHSRVSRYPIVARWRDDVFFTQASIYDFQPWVIEGVVEPPANPLVISQPCIRFNDIDNVGKTGRHLTFFEMMAHHAFNKDEQVYFKDRTVELCHQLFTDRLGTDPRRLRYVEEWWEGGGNSGPCLEVILDGAELATLVFMMYQDTGGVRKPLSMKVVDTGYGLERMVWVSKGSPSAYEAVFGPVLQYVRKEAGVSTNREALVEYSKVAGMADAKTASDVREIRKKTAARMDMSYDELMNFVSPLEDVYVVCDHTRALVFLLNDGVVPSNVREGYFARLLVRRAMRSLRSLGLEGEVMEIVNRQIDYFEPSFPELTENREDIISLVEVERGRYLETLSRGREMVGRITDQLGEDEAVPEEKLVELYDSHGLNPEIVREFSSNPVNIPDDFYIRVASRHEGTEEVEEKESYPEGLPPTELLFYDRPELDECEAEVLRVYDSGVVLDRTIFYPEGGGQECDLGFIGESGVKNVIRVGNSVIHYLEGELPSEGDRVHCSIDVRRRRQLMRHHTAAHIINGTMREMFGNHIWQAGVHKSADQARLDLTHYDNLLPEQREELERKVNEAVMEDIVVNTYYLDRNEAEQRYGHRLYQGGAVPGKTVRVIDIPGVDAEACGGIHCSRTGRVGPVLITGTRRVQDGVVRIEYTAGTAAVEEMQVCRDRLEITSDALITSPDNVISAARSAVKEMKHQKKELERLKEWRSARLVQELLEEAEEIDGVSIVFYEGEGGEDLTPLSKDLSDEEGVIAILFKSKDGSSQVMVSRSEGVEIDCRDILDEVTSVMGGGGGGKSDFAQGGGGNPSMIEEARGAAKSSIRKTLIKGSEDSRE